MTVLSGKTIRRLGIITPHVGKTIEDGMSYGESLAGYDIRVKETLDFDENQFHLASSIEYFNLPKNVIGIVHDKSSWARKGIAVQNTVIDPGFRGYLTLEISVIAPDRYVIHGGSPIAQIVFYFVDEDTDGYRGKYQDQPSRPVQAIHEEHEANILGLGYERRVH